MFMINLGKHAIHMGSMGYVRICDISSIRQGLVSKSCISSLALHYRYYSSIHLSYQSLPGPNKRFSFCSINIYRSSRYCDPSPQTQRLYPFSPPVRWGLLDFMWAVSSPFSSFFSSSPSSPSTAMVWVQCSALDLNRDPVSSVFRSGPQPQPRSLWGQCSAPDLNRDGVSSVFRAGPQLRWCEFSVSRRTSTAIMWGDISERMSEDMSEKMSKDMAERMSEDMSRRYVRKTCKRYVRRFVRKKVKRYVRKMSEKCQTICQEDFQKIC